MVSKSKRHPKQPIPAYAYPQFPPQFAPVPQPYPPLLPPGYSTGVNFSAMHDKNASVVNVVVTSRPFDYSQPVRFEFKASGSSKREQGDVHDEEIGELIAAARAFQSLSRQLMSEATKRVNASTKAQAAAKQRAQEKREAAKRPVKRRTRREWEELQKKQAREEATTKAAQEASDFGGTVERAG
jgi:hypothetical protein